MDRELLEKLAARRRFGMRPGLETIRTLLADLGNPQNGLRCVHIAGTNGKGAVAAMIDSCLRAAGYSCARYTSPHLLRLNERFSIDGRPASDAALSEAAAAVFPAVEKLERRGVDVTFFECLTAVAFVLFRNIAAHSARPSVAVLETGLGGRMDATNVIDGTLASVITRIGLDHCAWLGGTHAAIAREKAGIIKPGRPVVCGATPPGAFAVIESAARAAGSRLFSAPQTNPVRTLDSSPLGQTVQVFYRKAQTTPVRLPLAGPFQTENACTAAAALEVLSGEGFDIPPEALAAGLERTVWPGRFQRVREHPCTMVDGAHNPDGCAALRRAVEECALPQPVCTVAGFCADKDVASDLHELAAFSKSGFAAPVANPRTMPARETAALMLKAGFAEAQAFGSLREAIGAATEAARSAGGSVVVCGSLFLAGEALEIFGALPRRDGPAEPNEALRPS